MNSTLRHSANLNGPLGMNPGNRTSQISVLIVFFIVIFVFLLILVVFHGRPIIERRPEVIAPAQKG